MRAPDGHVREYADAGRFHGVEQAAGVNALLAIASESDSHLRPEQQVRYLPDEPPQQRPSPVTQSRSGWVRVLANRRWPLLLVLLIQAGLSARLIWANTAFADEALYVWIGHMEWTHWLSGTHIPEFQTYLSGAPVIYPPLGAAADSIGGLAAARALSLCFMLGATILLHGTARRLFNRTAATFAAALFAGTGAAEYLGSFATYDAMALFLLALAMWLAVIASTRRSWRSKSLLTLVGLVLILANATKYASGLFDPVVILTVIFMRWQRRRLRAGLAAGLFVVCVASLAAVAALWAGGGDYWHGITFTTLARPTGTSSPKGIVIVSLGWGGIVGGLALVGAVVVLCKVKSLPYRLLVVTLTVAVWMAPAEQARIHTFTSLFKHVGFGEWFAAIVAGLALASLQKAVPKVKSNGAVRAALAAVAACAIIGALLAGTQFASWPNSSEAIKMLRPLLSAKGSILVADNPNVIEYYLPSQGIGSTTAPAHGQALWPAIFNGADHPQKELTIRGPNAVGHAIKKGYFDVIALSNFRAWSSADSFIESEIAKYGGYKLVAAIPYTASGVRASYQIWIREGS